MTAKNTTKKLARALQDKVPRLSYQAALHIVERGQADTVEHAAALAQVLAERDAARAKSEGDLGR